MTAPPRICPDHPEAHVLHTFTRNRMETRQGGYVGIEWDEQHTYRCAVHGCQQRLAEPSGQGGDTK